LAALIVCEYSRAVNGYLIPQKEDEGWPKSLTGI